MTRHDLPLPALMDRFAVTRGMPADGDWAAAAAGRFMLDDVREEVMVRELTEALAIVEGSGEGPQELFGPGAEWARQCRAEAVSAGEPVLAEDPPLTWRAAPCTALIIAALLSVPFGIVFALGKGLTVEYTWGHLLSPMMLSALITVLTTLWSRTILRRSFAATVGIVVAWAAPLVVGAGFLLPTLAGMPLFTGNVAWLGAIVVGYLTLGLVGFQLLPTDDLPLGTAPKTPDDDAWALVLAGVLRSKLDYSDARAEEAVDEARAHAAESGRPLAEEFGTPQDYAARLRPDRHRRLRWEAILLTAVAAYWVSMLGVQLASRDASPEWWTIVGAVLFPLTAWRTWRMQNRARVTD
ncbi:hypothetical protein M3C59_007250 [Micrococcus luteus]|nr:hypothetical protein [Micrococcus luteus]